MPDDFVPHIEEVPETNLVGKKWVCHYLSVAERTYYHMLNGGHFKFVQVLKMKRFSPNNLFVDAQYNREVELDKSGLAHHQLVNVAYATLQLGVAPRTIYKMVEEGGLKAIRLYGSSGGLIIRFDRRDLPNIMDDSNVHNKLSNKFGQKNYHRGGV